MQKYKLRRLKKDVKVKIFLRDDAGYIICKYFRSYPTHFDNDEIVTVVVKCFYIDIPMKCIKRFEILGKYKEPFLKKSRFPSINY